MKEPEPYVITISRMLGSGGMFIGRQLSERLGIAYFDKEILAGAAKEFGLTEAELKERDEKTASLWELFLRGGALENPDIYVEPKYNLPSDRQLFEAESEIIRGIARERSAVIIGRGGVHVLRDHPRHISVFLHCEAGLRIRRIQDLFHLTEKEAGKLIAASDSNRSHYYHQFAGREWTDARQYALCIDTGRTTLDESVDMIAEYAGRKFKAGRE